MLGQLFEDAAPAASKEPVDKVDAADQGNAYGETNLGYALADGRGVAQDEVAAVVLYRRAAQKGNVWPTCSTKGEARLRT